MDSHQIPPPYEEFPTAAPSRGGRGSSFRQRHDGLRIVVGLDFGTTFSGEFVKPKSSLRDAYQADLTGFAWVSTRGENEITLDDVNSGTHGIWPARNGGKVPSQRSYSKVPTSSVNPPVQWGYDIAVDSTTVTWFKLGLAVREAEEELETLGKMTKRISNLFKSESAADITDLSKTAAEVLDDYLDKIIKHCVAAMREVAQEQMNEYPVDVIITHPVVSSQSTSLAVNWILLLILTRNGHTPA